MSSKETFIYIFSCFIVFSLIIFISNEIARASCNSTSEKMELNNQYGFFQGCLIEYEDGKWIPLKNYRVNSAR